MSRRGMSRPLSSSWIASIVYRRTPDNRTYLAVFLKPDPKPDDRYTKSSPIALLYADVPAWLKGLLSAGIATVGVTAGIGHRSVGRAYNRLLRGRYPYTRVEGRERVNELRRMMIG